MNEKLDTFLKAYQGSTYDFDNEILLNWYPRRIIERTKNAKSLLELGLGHGFTTNIFSKIFNRHVVIDGSSAVIENFRKNYPGCSAEIIETYFEKFMSNEKFDVIVMGFVLEHVDNPVEILAKYRNFLAPEGKMFVAVPNAESLNRRLGNIAGLLSDMQAFSENDIMLGHKRYYTVESLKKDIESAGYKLEKIEGIYLKPFTTQQIISLNLNTDIISALCEVGIDYPELCSGIFLEIKNY